MFTFHVSMAMETMHYASFAHRFTDCAVWIAIYDDTTVQNNTLQQDSIDFTCV